MPCSMTQHIDACGDRPQDLSIQSLTLYHYTCHSLGSKITGKTPMISCLGRPVWVEAQISHHIMINVTLWFTFLITLKCSCHYTIYEPHHEKTGFLPERKTKAQISCAVTNCIADQRLCFRYKDSAILLRSM